MKNHIEFLKNFPAYKYVFIPEEKELTEENLERLTDDQKRALENLVLINRFRTDFPHCREKGIEDSLRIFDLDFDSSSLPEEEKDLREEFLREIGGEDCPSCSVNPIKRFYIKRLMELRRERERKDHRPENP